MEVESAGCQSQEDPVCTVQFQIQSSCHESSAPFPLDGGSLGASCVPHATLAQVKTGYVVAAINSSSHRKEPFLFVLLTS